MISALLVVPDMCCCNVLVQEIADIYKTDRAKYEATARKWTQKYAMWVDLSLPSIIPILILKIGLKSETFNMKFIDL